MHYDHYVHEEGRLWKAAIVVLLIALFITCAVTVREQSARIRALSERVCELEQVTENLRDFDIRGYKRP